MNSKLLEMVKKLSKSDKKGIVAKTLKLSEETGELAAEVLPYSGAFATKKKFVKKEAILEEVVDVLLCALSIAYDLDFSQEEIEAMLQEKSLVWADLQNRERNLEEALPFEIHVTVHNVNKEEFVKICSILGVKPIILDLQNNDGKNVFEDVMSSSVFLGSNKTVYEEMKKISNAFKRAGFEVVREKIETVPWHPAAPSELHKKPTMPKNCYFECHFNVLTSIDQLDKLRAIAKAKDCHLSKNIFKKVDENNFKIMMTYRSYEGTREQFDSHNNEVEKLLKDEGFVLEKKIVEFAIYDTKISHDAKWLKKS